MRIRLVCVGKPRDRELSALHDRYSHRLIRFGVRYDTEWVPETQSGGRFSDDHARQRDSRALLERAGAKGLRVALDRTGRLLSSEELAGRFERWASPCACLLIGGPLGLHQDELAQVDERWSLSPLTVTHELARVLVVEQLYRAVCILRGVPYHR